MKGVCNMQISAINPAFKGRRDNIDTVVNMDDNTIRQIAYLQTSANYNHKKSRRITNALFYSAPIAAGLATAVLGKGGTSKIFSKEVSGLAARAANGLKVAGGWFAALAAIDLLGFGKKKLAENSQSVREFDRNHPFISMMGLLGAAFGAVVLVNKGGAKLGKVKAPEFMQKFTVKADKFLRENKIVLNAKTKLLNLVKRVPDALKEIGATALDWSPSLLLFGGLFHSIGSAGREGAEFNKNYTALKEKQNKLTKARMHELVMQNDFLMQDARNREEVALLQEVIN